MINNIIYLCELPNGKCYVGKTKNFSRRKKDHEYNAFSKAHKCYNTKFYRAIRKYGVSVLGWRVIEEHVATKDIDKRERWWIKKLGSYSDGYNMTIGGDGLVSPTLETKRKISRAAIGRLPWNKGLRGVQKSSRKRHKAISRREAENISKNQRSNDKTRC